MTTTSQPNGKKQIWNIVKWIVGVFLILVGLGFFGLSILAGIIILALGSLIIPPIYTKWWSKLKFLHKRLNRWIVYVVLLLLGFIIAGISVPEEEKERMATEKRIEAENKKQAKEEKENSTVAINEEIVEPEDTRPLIPFTIEKTATIRFDNASSYYVLIDKVDLPDATLTDKIKRLIDEIVKEKGAMLSIEIFDHKETLEKTYADDMPHKGFDVEAVKALTKLQKRHYIATFTGEMRDMPDYISNNLDIFPTTTSNSDTETSKYRENIKYLPTTRNNTTAKKQTENIKNADAASEKKKEAFEKDCFSVWDDSCTELVYYVKENMHNPKSFEHVKTQYSFSDNYAVVGMTYRGTNAYGGVVTETVRAKVSFDCKVLEIMK